jgi:hypothetical protein
MDGAQNNDALFVEEFPTAPGQIPPIRRFKFIAGDYFAAMGNPLLAGRALTWRDAQERRPVVVVSASLAREYWSSPAAAIGKRVRSIAGADVEAAGTGILWREIVGVVGDEYDDGVEQPLPAIAYWPTSMAGFWGNELFVQRSLVFALRTRAGVDPNALAVAARDAVWAENPNLPLASLRTQQEIYARSLQRTSFTVLLLGIAAAMALLLGLVGLYGVISYLVSLRTRELGLRLALGARPRDVVVMMVRHGALLTAGGVAIGIAVSLGAARLLASLLHGVSPYDLAAYGLVVPVLGVAALLASFVAARRAGRVEPMRSLRAE